VFTEKATELLHTHPPFVVLVVHKDWLKNLFLTLTWLQGADIFFNGIQSRVVIGLLNGHNTLSRHSYVMGLSNNPTCRKCGTKEETSVYILCECETLASLRHTHLGSFFLDPKDIRKLSIGAIWNFAKGTGFL